MPAKTKPFSIWLSRLSQALQNVNQGRLGYPYPIASQNTSELSEIGRLLVLVDKLLVFSSDRLEISKYRAIPGKEDRGASLWQTPQEVRPDLRETVCRKTAERGCGKGILEFPDRRCTPQIYMLQLHG
jgi:hypothetical protein